jgi:hypothetical protein
MTNFSPKCSKKSWKAQRSKFTLLRLITFNGKPTDDVAVRLMKSINGLEPSSVVFNWECSSGYSEK